MGKIIGGGLDVHSLPSIPRVRTCDLDDVVHPFSGPWGGRRSWERRQSRGHAVGDRHLSGRCWSSARGLKSRGGCLSGACLATLAGLS